MIKIETQLLFVLRSPFYSKISESLNTDKVLEMLGKFCSIGKQKTPVLLKDWPLPGFVWPGIQILFG